MFMFEGRMLCRFDVIVETLNSQKTTWKHWSSLNAGFVEFVLKHMVIQQILISFFI